MLGTRFKNSIEKKAQTAGLTIASTAQQRQVKLTDSEKIAKKRVLCLNI